MGLYEFWRRLAGAPPPGKGYMSTRRARQALDAARADAAKAGHGAVTASHLASALLRFEESSAALVLRKLEVDLPAVRHALENDSCPTPLQEIIRLADKERRVFGHLSVGTEHLLLALVVDGKNAVSRHLAEAGVKLPVLRELVVRTVDPVFNPDAD